MADMRVSVPLNLMELVEPEFVVRVVVVKLFSEPVAIGWLVGTLLLAHQQLILYD